MREDRREREDVPMTSRISWGAVFAGALVSMGILVFTGLIALGAHLSGSDPNAGVTYPAGGPGMTAGRIIYSVLATILAFGIGGFSMTAFSSAILRPAQAALHGLLSVAIMVIVFYNLFRTALFTGRPGFPLGVEIPNSLVTQGVVAELIWTSLASITFGGISFCASAATAAYLFARRRSYENMETGSGRRAA